MFMEGCKPVKVERNDELLKVKMTVTLGRKKWVIIGKYHNKVTCKVLASLHFQEYFVVVKVWMYVKRYHCMVEN